MKTTKKSTNTTNINKTAKCCAFFRAKLDKGMTREAALVAFNKSLQGKPNYLTKAGVLCVLDSIATWNGVKTSGDNSAA